MFATIQFKTICLVYCVENLKKYIKNYNFVCGFVWVRNLAISIKGSTWTEGVSGQGTEENIWTEDNMVGKN
jgi:hypothetical protein